MRARAAWSSRPVPGRPPPARGAASHRFQVEAFEVPSLWNRENGRVVARLGERGDQPEPRSRVGRGVAAELLEARLRHVVGARERQEAPPALEEPHRAEVDLLVAAHGGVEPGPAPREGWRIENDHAEARARSIETARRAPPRSAWHAKPPV